jgi:phosphatidylserine/phosphatidylglycerophosphate/cardiolipin synthase-like enzyme
MTLIFKAILLLSFSLYSFALDEIYFLPKQSDKAKDKIVSLIENANNKIDIAMYNFTYKKFYKALKKALKNDVDITLIYTKSKLKFSKKIKLIKTKRKQHIKLAIIDDKYVIFGSANWKKEAFGKNYEVINITDNRDKVKKFMRIFKELKKENN